MFDDDEIIHTCTFHPGLKNYFKKNNKFGSKEKTCYKCKVTQSVDNFHKRKSMFTRRPAYQSLCRSCRKEYDGQRK